MIEKNTNSQLQQAETLFHFNEESRYSAKALSKEEALNLLQEFQDKYGHQLEQTESGCIIKRDAPPRCTYKDHLVYRLVAQAKTWFMLPKDMVVRHTCDNPYCFNPSHLIVGTRAENNKDREKEKYKN